MSPDNCTLGTSFVRSQKNFQPVQNEEIIPWDATANRPGLSLQIKASCSYNEVFADLGRSRELPTVQYNIEYECPSPKSGCMIFYSYTINTQKKMVLLVSNCHSSSEILSGNPTTLSSIQDLHIFTVPEGIYPKLNCKGNPVEEMIRELFPKAFGSTLCQLFQFIDLAALSTESIRQKKMSEPISPAIPSNYGYKFVSNNLIFCDAEMNEVMPYDKVKSRPRTDILGPDTPGNPGFKYRK